MIEPSKIINAASTSVKGGGVSVDIEAIAVALITVCKANHESKESMLKNMSETWDACQIEVSIPGSGRA